MRTTAERRRGTHGDPEHALDVHRCDFDERSVPPFIRDGEHARFGTYISMTGVPCLTRTSPIALTQAACGDKLEKFVRTEARSGLVVS
jgi:hypothetical protein